MLVSFVANARPAAMPKNSAQVPGLILALGALLSRPSLCFSFAPGTKHEAPGTLKYPTPAQSIIIVKHASSISCMKSVAKNTNIGEVPRSSAPIAGTSQSYGARNEPLASLRMEMNANTSASAAKRSGVHLRRVPSIVARSLRPAAFCRAAAA